MFLGNDSTLIFLRNSSFKRAQIESKRNWVRWESGLIHLFAKQAYSVKGYRGFESPSHRLKGCELEFGFERDSSDFNSSCMLFQIEMFRNKCLLVESEYV